MLVGVVCGYIQTFALSKNGSVFSCGAVERDLNSSTFRQISGIKSISKILSRDYTAALTFQGQVFIWNQDSRPQVIPGMP
jgi:hypothetical protein